MITAGHRAFINRAVPVFRRDARIAGVALGGSYAKETMDEFSGLDFLIAVYPEEFDAVLADRVKLAEALGSLLSCFTGEHIQRPELLICMFGDPLLHVDLEFKRLDTIADRVEDPVILFERDTVMQDEFKKKPAQIPTPDLQWFEDRFWIWVHYIANRIGRGELFDAIEGLSFLRQRVLGPLMLMKNGRPPWGVRNVETAAPKETPRLVRTLAEHDSVSCLRALKAATDLYIYLRGPNKAKLHSREAAEKKALQYLSAMSDRIMP